MKKLLKYLLGLVLLLLIIGIVITTFFPERLVPFMLNQQLKMQQSQADEMNEILKDDERIYVYTVGTSSPLPNNRAQTGTAIIVNGHFFMFVDCKKYN